MALVAAVIIPIVIHFENKKAAKTPEEIAKEAEDAALEAKNWTALSSWLDALMSVFQYLYIIGAPGIFVSHCGVNQAHGLDCHQLAIRLYFSAFGLPWRSDFLCRRRRRRSHSCAWGLAIIRA
jgi:hypothetical protein